MHSVPGWEGWGEGRGWEGWNLAEGEGGQGVCGFAGRGGADWEAAAEMVRRPGEIIERVRLMPSQLEASARMGERARELENGEGARSGAGWMRSSGMMSELMRSQERAAVAPDCLEGWTTFLFRKAGFAELAKARDALPERWPVSFLDEVTGKRHFRRRRVRIAISLGPGGLPSLRVPEDMEGPLLRRLSGLGVSEGGITHPVGPKCARLLEVMRGYLDSGGRQAVLAGGRYLQKRTRRVIADALGLQLSEVGAADSSEGGGAVLAAAVDAYLRGELRVLVCDHKVALLCDLRACSAAVHRLTLPWTPAPFARPLPAFAPPAPFGPPAPTGPTGHSGNPTPGASAGGRALGAPVAVGDEIFYLAEGTPEFSRKAFLDIDAGWMGKLLSGAARYVPNPCAPDSEAYLDMLEPGPEAALDRRAAREARAERASSEELKLRLAGILRHMTEIRAEGLGEATSSGRGEAGAERSRAALRELKEAGDRRRAELDAAGAELNRLLMKNYRNGKIFRRLADEKAELDCERELLGLRESASEEAARRAVREAGGTGKPGEAGGGHSGAWLPAGDRAGPEAAAARDAGFLGGARAYLRSMAEKGLLSFDPGLMDCLDDVAVCADGTVARAGDRFRRPGPGGVADVEAVSFDHLARTVSVRVLGLADWPPAGTAPTETEFSLKPSFAEARLGKAPFAEAPFEKAPMDELSRWERLPSGPCAPDGGKPPGS